MAQFLRIFMDIWNFLTDEKDEYGKRIKERSIQSWEFIEIYL